jgi:DNA adenine methylase
LSNQPTIPSRQVHPPLKPFLRWAGGKSRITKLLADYVPETYNRYWEPFLGSGALYFYLRPKKAYLSDSNSALVDCFNHVKEYPEEIYKKLQEYKKLTSEDYYYEVRALYNKSKPSIAQSARFIYINKSNFNGIFRVNEKGKYNVPYGHKKSLAIPSLDEFIEISKLL